MLRLDINIVFTIINLLILYVIFRVFLFKPVNKIIEKRRLLVEQQFAEADDAKAQAEHLKSEYEAALQSAKEESDQILVEARSRAKTEYDRIMKEADADAGKMVEKAQQAIAAEKAKSLREMEAEITGLVMSAATKVVSEQSSDAVNSKLLDEFLTEVGDEK